LQDATKLIIVVTTRSLYMPARTARLFIRNTTPDIRLHLRDSHICRGEWTSSDLGATTGYSPWRRERLPIGKRRLPRGHRRLGKIATLDPFNNFRGAIYAYWENPYYGRTYFGFNKGALDVKADCDEDDQDTSGTSAFGDGTIPANPDLIDLFPVSLGYTQGDGSFHTFSAATFYDMSTLPWRVDGAGRCFERPCYEGRFYL
jgi:hypothetical protein